MFRTTLADVALLRDPMISIAELIDEGTFTMTKDGMSFIAADRAMVSVVDFHLSAGAFEKYEIDSDQKIGLNITNFVSIIKRAGTGDKISFEIKDAKLQVTIEGASKRRFLVPLMDLGSDDIPPIDQLKFESSVQISSSVLQSGLSDAEIVGDSVIIEISPGVFRMTAEDDVRKAEVELVEADEALITLSASKVFKSRYSLDYLKKMAKAAKMADTVTLKHGTDYPMNIIFAVGDKSKLSYILAPRVTES